MNVICVFWTFWKELKIFKESLTHTLRFHPHSTTAISPATTYATTGETSGMAPAKPSIRSISQQAFDEMVKENIDDLGMDPTEALSDAIETLTLQGVDLSGIVTSTLPGEINPVIQSLDRIKQLQSSDWTDKAVLDEARCLLDHLTELSRIEGSGNAAIATRNGGVELMCSVCSKLRDIGRESALVSALNALAAFLHGMNG